MTNSQTTLPKQGRGDPDALSPMGARWGCVPTAKGLTPLTPRPAPRCRQLGLALPTAALWVPSLPGFSLTKHLGEHWG